MPVKQCPKCGNMMEAEDMDKPAYFYYCDCGYEECDSEGWAEDKADQADRESKPDSQG